MVAGYIVIASIYQAFVVYYALYPSVLNSFSDLILTKILRWVPPFHRNRNRLSELKSLVRITELKPGMHLTIIFSLKCTTGLSPYKF